MRWCGPEVEVEGIVSLKTGGCPEDCHFCSQSGRFETPVRAVRLDIPSLVEAARETARHRRDRVLHRRRRARPRRAADGAGARGRRRRSPTAVEINVACSLGILTREQGERARRRSASTATTTTSRPRARTSATSSRRTRGRSAGRRCSSSASCGMEVCCGGIIGMGETLEQRAELAAQFAALDPDEVPLNFLDPRPGTPFADLDPVPGASDALRTIAAFRLALPRTILRFAGGRELTLGDLGARQGMVGGINAVIVGNYLTTLGPRPAGGPRPARRAVDAGQGAQQDAVITEVERRRSRPTAPAAASPRARASTSAAVRPLDPPRFCAHLRPQARGPGAARPATRRECVRCPLTRPAALHRELRDDRERAGPEGRCSTGARCCCCARTTTSGWRATRGCATRPREAAERWGAGAGASPLVSGHMAHPPRARGSGSPSSRAPRRACCSAPGFLANTGVIAALATRRRRGVSTRSTTPRSSTAAGSRGRRRSSTRTARCADDRRRT